MNIADALGEQTLSSLRQMGAHLRIARQRRNDSIQSWSERLFCSPSTVKRMERGDPAVSMGHYVCALMVLGLDKKFVELVSPDSDVVGRGLEALRVRRAYRRRKIADEFAATESAETKR